MNIIIQECDRILRDYDSLLKRHLYLRERVTTIQAKLLEASPENGQALAKQVQDKLNTLEQRIQALQNDPWLDQLFSSAENDQQVEEIKRYMQRWGKSSYESVAHCIVDHADRHDFSKNKLRYLRKGANFNKKRAKRVFPELGVVRWNKGNEYMIE